MVGGGYTMRQWPDHAGRDVVGVECYLRRSAAPERRDKDRQRRPSVPQVPAASGRDRRSPYALRDESLVRRFAECSIDHKTQSRDDDHDDDLGEPDGHCVQVHDQSLRIAVATVPAARIRYSVTFPSLSGVELPAVRGEDSRRW